MFSSVAIACSSGRVIVVSTRSGVAPGYVVMMTTYGKSMFGSRSGVIRVKATAPSTSTAMTATNMVSGFFTLNFDISISQMHLLLFLRQQHAPAYHFELLRKLHKIVFPVLRMRKNARDRVARQHHKRIKQQENRFV